ncbi:MAG: 4'-phosphopantetheinyl transferase superfamily protein [Bacteroidales bacterium]|nr:4'-phosphopantetheinyl transferase superfamily protein [Bacteroidales bacterium]
MVELYAIKVINEQWFGLLKPDLLNLLPETVIHNLKRFRNRDALQRNLLGEVLCRAVLAQKEQISVKDVQTYRKEKGKPFYSDFPQWNFNISHSAEWVVMGFSDSELGVDIEKIRTIDYRLAQRFFSEEENVNLNERKEPEKQIYFFDLWTIKESYLKFLGKGLTKTLKSFTVHDQNGNFYLKHDCDHRMEVFFNQYDIGDHCRLSVCSGKPGFEKEVRFITVNELIAYSNT